MKTIYKKALSVFGADAQIIKLFSEMSELGVAITHFREGKTSHSDIAIEIADVEIMLGQMKILFECEKTVEIKKVKQLKKLNGIIKKETLKKFDL